MTATTTTTEYKCSTCNGAASIRDSILIYGRSYGLALICNNYPRCDSFVGCHKDTGLPKGSTANPPLREARKAAHRAFDGFWQPIGMRRHQAYSLLAREVGVPKLEAHIGMFNVEQCNKVVEIYSRPLSLNQAGRETGGIQ